MQMCSNYTLFKIGFGLGVATAAAIAIKEWLTDNSIQSEVDCRLNCLNLFTQCLDSVHNAAMKDYRDSKITLHQTELFKACEAQSLNCANACIAIAKKVFTS